MGDVMFAAAGEAPSRFLNAFGEIRPYALNSLDKGERPSLVDTTKAFGDLLSITSTWRNAEKAIYLAEYQLSLNKRGDTTAEGEFSRGDIAMQALGMTPSRIGRVYELKAYQRNLKHHRQNVTTSVVKVMFDYSREIKTADTESHRNEITAKYNNMQTILLSSLRSEEDRRLVMEGVQRKLTDESLESKGVNKHIESFTDGRLADLHTIQADLNARGILQFPEPNKGE